MSIKITGLTAVLRRSAVEACYPRGIEGLRLDWRVPSQDEHLVGVAFSSSDMLFHFIGLLRRLGYDFDRGCAVGEVLHGEWMACPGIAFYPTGPAGRIDRGWEAVAMPLEGDVMH